LALNSNKTASQALLSGTHYIHLPGIRVML